MRKFYVISLLVLLLSGFIPLSAQAVVHYRDVSLNTRKSVYSCSIRKQKCTVYKISYMQRNRAYYDSECTGTAFEQGSYAKAVETDVRLKRFEYCSLVSSSF